MLLNILLKYHGLVVEEYTSAQEAHFIFLKIGGLLIFFGLGISVLSHIVKFLFDNFYNDGK